MALSAPARCIAKPHHRDNNTPHRFPRANRRTETHTAQRGRSRSAAGGHEIETRLDQFCRRQPSKWNSSCTARTVSPPSTPE